jgi:V8-like Glu-specific endopeptidase
MSGSKIVRCIPVALVAVSLLGVVPGASGEGSRTKGPRITRSDGLVRIALDPADREAWTPARMAAAEPISFTPAQTPQLSAARRIDLATPTDATPVLVPGSASSSAVTTSERLNRVTAGPLNYQRFQITNPEEYPNSTHGKLYMQLYDDSEAVCSGTVVPSAAGMTVMTAGHCLVSPETGVPVKNAVFVPGYQGDSQNPYGFWFAESLIVTDEWWDSSQPGGEDADARYDVAAFNVMQYPEVSGTLAETVGWRGIAFNLPQGQTYQSYGFPAAGNFDGEKMISCVSDPAIVDRSKPGPPMPNGMGCDMTGGSSGGGWVIEDQYVNSVVSYSIGFYKEMQFGPYFGEKAIELFETISGLEYPDAETPAEQEFNTSINLKLRKHLKVSGRVSSSDPGCAAGALFVIAKVKGENAVAVAQGIAGPDGSFATKVKDKPGKYVALALDSYRDSFTICNGSQSQVIKHQH